MIYYERGFPKNIYLQTLIIGTDAIKENYVFTWLYLATACKNVYAHWVEIG